LQVLSIHRNFPRGNPASAAAQASPLITKTQGIFLRKGTTTSALTQGKKKKPPKTSRRLGNNARWNNTNFSDSSRISKPLSDLILR
jgi:hypothetical protein